MNENSIKSVFISVIDNQNHMIGNTCFKGTPEVLKHYSGLLTANPGGLRKPRRLTFLRRNRVQRKGFEFVSTETEFGAQDLSSFPN